MALVRMEGFEQFGDHADLVRAYNTGSAGSMTLIAGRDGNGQALRGPASNQPLYMGVPAAGEYIVGFALRVNSNISGTHTVMDTRRLGDDHVELLLLSTGELRVELGVTTLGTTSGLGLVADTWYYIEWRMLIDQTAGETELWVDGVQELDLDTLDTQANDAEDGLIDRLNFYGHSTNTHDFDDIYVCDTTGLTNNTFLGPSRVETTLPDGDGNRTELTQLSGLTNYEMVDDGSTPDDDTTYNSGSTVGNTDLYTFADLVGWGGTIDTVAGVRVVNHCRKVEAGQRTVRALARSNVTEVEGDAKGVGVDFAYLDHIYETDPDGGGAWDETAFNAAEFGITIEA